MYLAPAAAHNRSREPTVCMDDEGRRECFPDICSTRQDTLAAQQRLGVLTVRWTHRMSRKWRFVQEAAGPQVRNSRVTQMSGRYVTRLDGLYVTRY